MNLRSEYKGKLSVCASGFCGYNHAFVGVTMGNNGSYTYNTSVS